MPTSEAVRLSGARRILTGRHVGSRVAPAVAVFLLALVPSRPARGSAYDGFDYPHRPAPSPNNYNGGYGFSDKWYFLDGHLRAGSLSDPTGTLLTTGNHVGSTDGIGGGGTNAQRPIAQTVGTSGTDLWVSWLMRRGGPDSVNRYQGLLIIYPTVGNVSYRPYFIGEPGPTGLPGPNPFDGSLVIESHSQDRVLVGPLEPDRTVFMAAHFSFVDGNDTVTVFLNPTPGSTAPTGGVTYNGIDFHEGRPLFSFLSADNNNGSDLSEFDELRVGSTYAEVAPTVPEPVGLALFGAASAGLLCRRRR